jgi:hypothetical protein
VLIDFDDLSPLSAHTADMLDDSYNLDGINLNSSNNMATGRGGGDGESRVFYSFSKSL